MWRIAAVRASELRAIVTYCVRRTDTLGVGILADALAYVAAVVGTVLDGAISPFEAWLADALSTYTCAFARAVVTKLPIGEISVRNAH
jgi:hypothetical protein